MLEGFEGGFAVGASVITALSFTELDRHLLIVTALISIIVNGFNASALKYGSEHYLDEIDGREKRSPFKTYFIPSFIEFVAYFSISFLTILPLFFIDSLLVAVLLSCTTTIVVLFAAGWWRGRVLRLHPWRDAIETTILGCSIIAFGVISGLVIYAVA